MTHLKTHCLAAAAILPFALLASPASAQESEGRFQIKAFLTTVQPDAAITDGKCRPDRASGGRADKCRQFLHSDNCCRILLFTELLCRDDLLRNPTRG